MSASSFFSLIVSVSDERARRRQPGHRMVSKIFAIVMILSGLGAPPVLACQTLSEPQKIEVLLKLIGDSDMQFIRNGEPYDGIAAKKHLEGKLRYAGDKITTAEEFIHYIASQSSFTGELYFVQLIGGRKIKSEDWLTEQLSIINANDCDSHVGK
jgi:hypothetical protein